MTMAQTSKKPPISPDPRSLLTTEIVFTVAVVKLQNLNGRPPFAAHASQLLDASVGIKRHTQILRCSLCAAVRACVMFSELVRGRSAAATVRHREGRQGHRRH